MNCKTDHLKILTPFCPGCGVRISASPIQELRAHLWKYLALRKEQRRRMGLPSEYWDARPNERDSRREEHNGYIARWQSWVDAIEDLIERAERPAGEKP